MQESIHTFKFLKAHLLQVGRSVMQQGLAWVWLHAAAAGAARQYTSSTCRHAACSASQAGKEGDELLVVHVSKSKEKEKEKWDHGSAVIADLHTALQPYKHDVYDLEVRACWV